MEFKAFRNSWFFLLTCSLLCFAEPVSDQKLVELAKQSFIGVKAAKNEPDGMEAILNAMGHLNDSQRTRALALRMFDFDKTDGRFKYNAADVVMYVFRYDSDFIKDSSPLKEMMKKETDARRIYLLSAMANHLMRTQKTDFVVEMAPMLLRHEPLAKMVDSDYYISDLTDASKYFYSLVLKNLRLLNSPFVPPDPKLAVPERIAILIKWLKENHPGCERLGEKAISSSISSE